MQLTEISTIARLFFYAALAFSLSGILMPLFKRDSKKSYLSTAAVVFAVMFFVLRGIKKEFIPFIDKVESFAVLFLFLNLLAVIYEKKLSLSEYRAALILAILSGSTAMLFTDTIRYPSPYMRTIWFPLHVPLSFSAYALWLIAGIKAISILIQKTSDEKTNEFINVLNRYGFLLFSLSMAFGGIWGYLAWGAYFIWDPKIVWSLILWLFYSNLLHIDLIPRFKSWKPSLYALGILLIMITFIGTSFFSRSIHRF